jgi:ubiquinone/menaquinone biosynthesis C-methylase UbiE
MNRNDRAFPFDRIAQTYSQFRYPNEKLIEHIFNRVRYADNVLEVGCGPADYLSILSELLNARGYGFDISQNMIEEAKRKNSSLELVISDAQEPFPYGDGCFDFVFNINLVHYLSELDNLFRESYRVLMYDGNVLTVTDSCQDIEDRTLTHYFPEVLEIDRKRYPGNSAIMSAMKQAGFEGIYTTKVKTTFEFKSQHYEQYSERAYSALRLISEEAFESGMKRVEDDMAIGLVIGKKSYTQIWGIKVEKREFDLPTIFSTGYHDGGNNSF